MALPLAASPETGVFYFFFHALKGGHGAAGVHGDGGLLQFLTALARALSVALGLLVYRLGQRQFRQTLQQANQTLPNQFAVFPLYLCCTSRLLLVVIHRKQVGLGYIKGTYPNSGVRSRCSPIESARELSTASRCSR
jgi:hypothetical protein